MPELIWLWFSLIVSVLALGVAWLFSREVIAADSGSDAMKEIAGAIKEGAEAFLRRQYITIYSFSIGLAVLIFGFYSYTWGTQLAVRVVISFLVGAVCSGLAGASGMFVSIRANLRAASAARTQPERRAQDRPARRRGHRPLGGGSLAAGRGNHLSGLRRHVQSHPSSL